MPADIMSQMADDGLCACGSGLRFTRCCGFDPAGWSLGGSAELLAPVVERAVVAFDAGDAAQAERLCRAVLDLVPTQAEALSLLYRLRHAAGDERAAETLLRRIVLLFPNTFWAISELTIALLGKGTLGEAEQHARNAIRIAPENPQAHNLMGMVMTEANRSQVGEYHYRRVLELSRGRDPILLANLAWNLKNQGRITEARSLYEEASSTGDEVLQTLVGWARMEEADRKLERALELLERAERVAPDNASVLLSRAVVYGRLRDYERALALLDKIAALSSGGQLGANELLEKGRLLDKMGNYDEAFEAFIEGKRVARESSGLAYDDNAAGALIGRLRSFFTEGRLRLIPRVQRRADAALPIFILGFPRSGTTLVEQTLTAHPQIAAGDELPFIGEIAAAMPRMLDSPLTYPEALSELWMGDRRAGLDQLRSHYLERVLELGIVGPGTVWFTDKMPLNETHLGLIALTFPEAPLIHVVRHPLDVVFSVFSNHLTHGFYCACALETAARHYVRTMELVEHYRAEMALRYLPLRYEELVTNQEPSVRRAVGFIGAEFDPACLKSHENRRYARTASYAQVAEPLYDTSCYRYRNYRKQLEPIIPILEPLIHRLGYDV